MVAKFLKQCVSSACMLLGIYGCGAQTDNSTAQQALPIAGGNFDPFRPTAVRVAAKLETALIQPVLGAGSGSIVGPHHILTAAHVASGSGLSRLANRIGQQLSQGDEQVVQLYVESGEHFDPRSRKVAYSVRIPRNEIYLHAGFDEGERYLDSNDVAVLVLEEDSAYPPDYRAAVTELPQSATQIPDCRYMVTGYGDTDSDDPNPRTAQLCELGHNYIGSASYRLHFLEWVQQQGDFVLSVDNPGHMDPGMMVYAAQGGLHVPDDFVEAGLPCEGDSGAGILLRDEEQARIVGVHAVGLSALGCSSDLVTHALSFGAALDAKKANFVRQVIERCTPQMNAQQCYCAIGLDNEDC